MKIGRFTIEQLSEGHFEIFSDGSFHKLAAPEEDRFDTDSLTGGDSAIIGIDPILISDGDRHLLLDTGLGWGLDAGSSYRGLSNAMTNLEIFGLSPEDITDVVLTHLHYDHAAGSSFTGSEALTRPTFPNATYYLQQREWDYAVASVTDPEPKFGASYRLDDLYRLYADGYFALLEQDSFEVLPGVKLQWTGGHTPGHQVVIIRDNGEAGYYLGDLLPDEKHLNRYRMRRLDSHPADAKKWKIQLLRKAYREEACLLFYHSLQSKAGMLAKGKKDQYLLKKIDP